MDIIQCYGITQDPNTKDYMMVLKYCDYGNLRNYLNQFISEETPYSNIPHDHGLAIKICKGLRPKISQDTPKLLADLIIKCWDSKVENRPTARELYQNLDKWKNERWDKNTEIFSQI